MTLICQFHICRVSASASAKTVSEYSEQVNILHNLHKETVNELFVSSARALASKKNASSMLIICIFCRSHNTFAEIHCNDVDKGAVTLTRNARNPIACAPTSNTAGTKRFQQEVVQQKQIGNKSMASAIFIASKFNTLTRFFFFFFVCRGKQSGIAIVLRNFTGTKEFPRLDGFRQVSKQYDKAMTSGARCLPCLHFVRNGWRPFHLHNRKYLISQLNEPQTLRIFHCFVKRTRKKFIRAINVLQTKSNKISDLNSAIDSVTPRSFHFIFTESDNTKSLRFKVETLDTLYLPSHILIWNNVSILPPVTISRSINMQLMPPSADPAQFHLHHL